MPDPQSARAEAQKKTLRAEEQARADVVAERQSYQERIAPLDRDELIFIDEAGITTKMTRLYARAPKGQRALSSAPYGSWRRLTLLGALGMQGLVAVMSVEAATSTPVFLAFLRQVLIPALQRHKPGATVIMDNLRPHRAKAVGDILEEAGFRLLYLPRYSPELSPIEPCWAKIKTLLRSKAARTIETLNEALGPALDAVTAHDARGWFKHCGYTPN